MTIAAQLTAEYWFDLYITWFAPLVHIAAMGNTAWPTIRIGLDS